MIHKKRHMIMVSDCLNVVQGKDFIPVVLTAFLNNSFAFPRIVILLPCRSTWATKNLES